MGGSLAHPDTVSLHVPIVSLARLTVYPLGLEDQEGGNSNSEADEKPDQPIENHVDLGTSLRRYGHENDEETQSHRSVPGNSTGSAAVTQENRPYDAKPENAKPVYRVTKETPRRDQDSN